MLLRRRINAIRSHISLGAIGIAVTSQRDAGSLVQYSFSLPQGSETAVLLSLLEAMENSHELSVPDPANGDCSLEARRTGAGFEIKRGCHGASGTWRSASVSEAQCWLLPGVLVSSRTSRPGFGAVLVAYK